MFAPARLAGRTCLVSSATSPTNSGTGNSGTGSGASRPTGDGAGHTGLSAGAIDGTGLIRRRPFTGRDGRIVILVGQRSFPQLRRYDDVMLARGYLLYAETRPRRHPRHTREAESHT
jgi:hypothetical protein